MITKRSAIDIGLACSYLLNPNIKGCSFCYYRHCPKEQMKFREFDEIKKLISDYREIYKILTIDLTGGEPTEHPKFFEICDEIKKNEMKVCPITHCQRLADPEFVQRCINSVDEFLLSIHGKGDVHDKMVGKEGAFAKVKHAIINLDEAKIPYRVNCVVTNDNYHKLKELVTWLRDSVKLRTNLNFIIFNPFNEWGALKIDAIQPRHSTISSYLREAIAEIKDCCEVNVRYYPFCFLKGMEQTITGFAQIYHDKYEWDPFAWLQIPQIEKFKIKVAAVRNGVFALYPDELPYNAHAIMQRNAIYIKDEKCLRCDLFMICDGFSRGYHRAYGTKEAEPYTTIGNWIFNPTHFRNHCIVRV